MCACVCECLAAPSCSSFLIVMSPFLVFVALVLQFGLSATGTPTLSLGLSLSTTLSNSLSFYGGERSFAVPFLDEFEKKENVLGNLIDLSPETLYPRLGSQ